MQQVEMYQSMDTPEAPSPVETPKKPRLTGKAKREAMTELSSLIRYRSEHDPAYEPSEGARKLLGWLLCEVGAAKK
jgi:hypothetical protein